MRKLARERFGFEELRPGQLEAVAAVLEGKDVLAIMPTGSGKSAIYQLAGLMIEGPTIVVSPLIALQRDQVEALQEGGIAQAAQVNSTLSESEIETAWERLHTGDLEFLFLAPEQFANDETAAHLAETSPTLFVVDEAHCISSWGHDFRPEYLDLGDRISQLGHPPVLALTATASPVVREEILKGLAIEDAEMIVRGFDRPNISLSVERFVDERSKQDAVLDALKEVPKPGIVYVATRKSAEELSGLLWQNGIEGVYYHGGMNASEREQAQESWMEDVFDVVIATTAFGMGINKPDVRFVFHHDIPESLDAYYQEIGRAGRDGAASQAHLFYRSEDLGIRRYFASGSDDRKKVEQSRVDMMRAYAETKDCRRQFLLNYFGEAYDDPCGNCDNCLSGSVVEDAHQPFELNSRVKHEAWGEGLVVRYEGDKIVVLFDEEGYKTLSVRTVTERNLLEPAD